MSSRLPYTRLETIDEQPNSLTQANSLKSRDQLNSSNSQNQLRIKDRSFIFRYKYSIVLVVVSIILVVLALLVAKDVIPISKELIAMSYIGMAVFLGGIMFFFVSREELKNNGVIV